MSKKLDRIQQAGAAFRASVQEVNELLVAAEAHALEMVSGMPMLVETGGYVDEATGEEFDSAIGVQKTRDRWRLVIGWKPSHADDWRWSPLLEASLQDRLDAVKHIEKLLDTLVASQETMAQEAGKAAKILRQTLREFGTETGGAK